MSPRRAGRSATRRRILIYETVDIGAEPRGVDRRGVGERGERGLSAHVSVASNGGQLADRDPVASHDEALSGIEGPHHLAAPVAQLPLGDLACHNRTVARVRQFGDDEGCVLPPTP